MGCPRRAMMSTRDSTIDSGGMPELHVLEAERLARVVNRRSLITDILTVQFLITGAITVFALAGLTWTSGAVIQNNLTYWAEQWARELNELGAPFYLQD